MGGRLTFFKLWLDVITSRVTLTCWGVLSIWVALAGPFGTFETLDFPERLLFWGGQFAIGILIGVFFRLLVTTVLNITSFWISALLISAMNTLAFTPPLSLLVNFWLQIDPAELPTWQRLGFFVFILTFGVALVRHAVKRDITTSAPVAPAPEQRAGVVVHVPTVPKLVQRLDAALHGALVSITVRDHYVDVRTRAGGASLLMRMTDAIAETEGTEGAQVHRSHWVAWEAVEAVERASGKTALRLRDGRVVPVSRANVAKVDERGLI